MTCKSLNLIKFLCLFLLCLCSIIRVSEAENKLLMITDKSCLYCIIWEKQIGKIYPKTDIAKDYSLKDSFSRSYFENKKFNLGISYGWQRLIPQYVLSRFQKGVFGFH